ncbi:MAG: recombinase family protein [Kofleriaceae bacterium]|nr:recombinase family protein [Kofleriaceae bacterium]
MIPAAIYARYSTDNQDSRSIEDQVRQCRAFAERMGIEVVAVFSDAAVSGTHTNRDGLRRMLAVVTGKRCPFRVVIVEDLSRLSRDIGDTHAIVFRDLAGAGVKVMDTSGLDSESESGELQIALKSIIGRDYIRTLAKMTHRGLKGRALGGFATGGRVYGYTTVAEPNPTDPERPRRMWQIVEPEAAIVRRIFAAVADDGASYHAIARELNAEGVAPPGNGRVNRGGWGHTSIRQILHNEKYAGRFIWNAKKPRTNGKPARHVKRPESEHIVREMPELALIDRATWDRVRERIARRALGAERVVKGGSRRVFLVSGLLRCGSCGGSIGITGTKKRANGDCHATFGCLTHTSRGDTICPEPMRIGANKITRAVIEHLRERLTGPGVVEAMIRGFERRLKERARAAAKPADLDRQLAAARKRVQNATRLLVEDPDDLDIRRQREADRAEVRRLEEALAEQAPASRPLTIPSRKDLEAALGTFVSALATDPVTGRAALASALATPLTLNRKPDGPSRYRVTGSLSVGSVIGAPTWAA